MITRGKDIELQRLRSEVQELSNALYMAWPYAMAACIKMARDGTLTKEDAQARDYIDDVNTRIARERVDAGREDAA